MAHNEFRVLFAKIPDAKPPFGSPAIVLSLSPDKWNDFSFRTFFVFKVYAPLESDKAVFSGDLRLGFRDRDEDPFNIVTEILSKSRAKLVRPKPSYYTMLPSLQHYRDIVSTLGIRRARSVLSALNDVIECRRRATRPKWLDSLFGKQVFNESFLRTSDSFFTFYNADSILNGLELERVGEISTQLHLQFKLPTFENAHKVSLSFGSDKMLPRRIAVFIGKNGIGKSQALFNIASSLLERDLRLQDENGDRPKIHRLIAIGGPGETGNTFPSPSEGDNISYKRIQLSPPASEDQGLGAVLQQLVRLKESVKTLTRWELFLGALGAIGLRDELFVEVRPKDNDEIANVENLVPLHSLRKEAGEQKQLRLWGSINRVSDVCRQASGQMIPISSGEIIFVRIAAQICLFIENGTLVLFDEPETHLHPNLVSQLVSLFDNLLQSTGSIAILATHSAYFVREVTRSQVYVFKEVSEGKVEIVTPRLKTLGADVGAISHFAFGGELFGGSVKRLREHLIKNKSRAKQLLEQIEADLPGEAYMYLRRELGLNVK